MIADSNPITRCVAAGLDVGTWSAVIIPPIIVAPVVIRGNQSARAVVQLQCRISQCSGNAILSKLRTYGTNNYPLCLRSLNNEASNHHVIAGLNKGACTDVT